MGQMSKRSSNRRELWVLGSFRNFAHREAVGSFRKTLASALRLQSSVYEVSEIGLTDQQPAELRLIVAGEDRGHVLVAELARDQLAQHIAEIRGQVEVAILVELLRLQSPYTLPPLMPPPNANITLA
jgi:hypothetical protein